MAQTLPRDAAEERLRWITPYLERKRLLKEVAELSPFTYRTLKRWAAAYKRKGLEGLFPQSRRPTDNGHLERFNRTLQQECLSTIPRSLKSWSKEIPEYLEYYNKERPHMGLHYKTPLDVAQSY